MNKDRAQLIEKLFAANTDDIQIVRGIFDLARHENHIPTGRRVRELAGQKAVTHKGRPDQKDFLTLYWDIMLWLAPNDFDSYMLYLERNRPPKERFYQPRRKVLKRIVDAIQRLVDDELDELVLSMPARTGKTTLLLMLVTWIIGRTPEISNLYSAFSDTITSAFYSGILEIIDDPDTYAWKEIFPKANIAATNAKDETLDIGRAKRYKSITCRSLYGTLNGACDVEGFLIADDLIGGIEEALNPDRLKSAQYKVSNNLLRRCKGGAKILWNGTRWSTQDPTGNRIELLQTSPEFKDRRIEIINIPALDENDESNFDYDYGVGFSTEHYRQVRAEFEANDDEAGWLAQCQGEPIERHGMLFDPEGMRFYNGELPPGDPDRIFSYIDPAFGGGDYVSAPVAYQYGDDVYIHDVVFDNSDKFVTRPKVVVLFERNSVGSATFEGTKSTAEYMEWIDNKLREDGYRVNIKSKAASTRVKKEVRIFDRAPEIREFYFRDRAHRTPEYALFMRNLHSFTMTGKNKHDDSPDSLAGLCDMIHRANRTAVVFQRPF